MTQPVWDQASAACARLDWRGNAAQGRRCAVVGFDGSASSAAALAYASGWAKRNQAGVVVVHVDAAPGTTLAEYECAAAGVVVPAVLPHDFSAEVAEAMAFATASWAYLNVRGDVADQLEAVARELHADVVVVGRSTRRRLRIGHSVARRLLCSTRHVIVVV